MVIQRSMRYSVRSWNVAGFALAFGVFACSDPTDGLDGGALDGGPPETGTPFDFGADSGPDPVDLGVDLGPDLGGPGDLGRPDLGPCEIDDPSCASCQADGECCEFSINCQPGSICNLPSDLLYDPMVPDGVCFRVVCSSNADCTDGKVCTAQNLCQRPVCQNDSECTDGALCISGSCQAAPMSSTVDRCEVVSRSSVTSSGRSVPLAAVAFDAQGAVIPKIRFRWVSDAPDAVQITGAVASGAQEGIATINAAVLGNENVRCTGSVRIQNFEAFSMPTRARVVVLSETTGLPVQGVNVHADGAAGAILAPTDAQGVALFNELLQGHVTVEGAGYQPISVLSANPQDVLIHLSEVTITEAGGFRGAVDTSAQRLGDIQHGIVASALPLDVMAMGRGPLYGADILPTLFDIPELGLKAQEIDLYGGALFGVGNRRVTEDMIRCQGGGTNPGERKIGCFLARAPAHPTALWTLTGELRLSQVTSTFNDIFGGGPLDPLFLPPGIWSTYHHGLLAVASAPSAEKVNTTNGQGDCSDPDLANYDSNCEADFSAYTPLDLSADAGQTILAPVDVPDLPPAPGGCAKRATLMALVALEGRGLVPMGISEGFDETEQGSADCVINGVEEPFGENSPPLSDGQMPLRMAPRHSGAEDGALYLAMIAQGDEPGAISVVIEPRAAINTAQESFQSAFKAPPEGTIDRASGNVSLPSTQSRFLTRLELETNGRRWTIYIPGGATNVQLPSVPGVSAILSGAQRATLIQADLNGMTIQQLFELSSSRTAERLFETVTRFSAQRCGAGQSCQLQ